MRTGRQIRARRSEKGVALLISIFILLLISVVAIALVVSSGTETALAGNYRSATGVYYASLAGLEEVRGRLRPQDPNSFKNTAPATFLHLPGNTLAMDEVRYVLNPGPTDPADTRTAYPDTEYDTEFGAGKLAAANVQTTPSVWNRNPLNALPVPGPFYKWVRINAVSEQSLQLDVAPYDGTSNDAVPIFYDGTTGKLNNSISGAQVLEITALAVLPNGSQKLLQYLVGPAPLNISFPSAFTILGTNTVFNGTIGNAVFLVDGIDQQGSGGTCGAPQPTLPAIGVLSATEVGYVVNGGNGGNGILPPDRNEYEGLPPPSGPPKPSVLSVTLPQNMQTPAALDGLVQLIAQSPDTVSLPGDVDSNSLPYQMSPSNPMTVFVNGNFVLTNGATGYGLLIVTGKLSYTGDSGWKGIVLVVGEGKLFGSNAGTNEFDGAVLVASTRDNTGNLLAAFGQAELSLAPAGGNGIFYNSCRINDALPSGGSRILSFHEISQ